ncbi:MAG: efflux transporter outer membrane subunit [Parachlamydia sp.]|nr:efflux transporter outer membrane subunit [Parachlamydia sp.]
MRHIALLLLLVSCNVGPRYQAPEPDVPSEWKHAQPSVDYCLENWWEIFQDPELNAYEEQAIADNPDLAGALERVVQARAVVGIVGADMYPQLRLGPVYNNQGILEKVFGTKTFIREHQLTYLLPINLTYELDLWGKLRNRTLAAFRDFQAQQEAYRTALLILTADVASTYYQIRSLDRQLDLFSKTIQTRSKGLEINQARYDYKVINYLDVAQASVELKNVESQYADAHRVRDLNEDRLAMLLGVPATNFEMAHRALAEPPPPIPSSLPSTVLFKRPDIAEAERTMAAENARVGAATAEFFPSITLTGALGYSSPDLDHFLKWSSRFWAFGATLDQMVYDAGRDSSNLALAWSRFREADDAYQQTVLVAFREVEDALANLEWFAKEADSVQEAVNAAHTAYQISMDRYKKGLTFYLNVVDSERQELDNERVLNDLLYQRYLATIQFIKAIGGGW